MFHFWTSDDLDLEVLDHVLGLDQVVLGLAIIFELFKPPLRTFIRDLSNFELILNFGDTHRDRYTEQI